MNAQARPLLNIGLTRFEAIPMDNAVRLEWETETELGTAGYKLKRGQNGTFTYLQMSDGSGDVFINSEGGPSQGSSYQHVDQSTQNGESYTYQLVEVTVDGGETLQADLQVTAGIEPTNTPIVLGGGGGDGENNTTTAEATSSPTATSTSSSTNGSTPTVITTSPTITPQTTDVPSPSPTRMPPTRTPISVNPTSIPPTQPSNSQVQAASPTAEQLTAGPAVEVAQALEETPVPSVDDQALAVENNDQEVQNFNNQESTTGSEERAATDQAVDETNSQPTVIGQLRSIESPSSPDPGNAAQESNPDQDSLLGRIYLWIAFIAAVVIFISAVLGAILLYTRRRKRE